MDRPEPPLGAEDRSEYGIHDPVWAYRLGRHTANLNAESHSNDLGRTEKMDSRNGNGNLPEQGSVLGTVGWGERGATI
jgi:hypothetical protein